MADMSNFTDEDIEHLAETIDRPDVEILWQVLSRIKALTEAPHWETARRERINELASAGLNTLNKLRGRR